MSVMLETATEEFKKNYPDPLDDRHPHRTHPDSKLGNILKVIFNNDDFMTKLVVSYVLARDNPELSIQGCRLLLACLPGLDSKVVFSEPEDFIPRLYQWAGPESTNEALQGYATGLLAAALGNPENASKYRIYNTTMIPFALSRLRELRARVAEENGGEAQNQKLTGPTDFSELNGVSNKSPSISIREFEVPTTIAEENEQENLKNLDDSNSKWDIIQPFSIGTQQMYPLSLATYQRFILQYLKSCGEYQDKMTTQIQGTSSARDQVHREELSPYETHYIDDFSRLCPYPGLTPSRMLDFLLNKDYYETVLTILHASVAQKSYGSERRFFCPPPCVYLSTAMNQRSKEYIAYIGVDSDYTEWQQLDFSNGKGYSAAKKIYISDSDARKVFNLNTKVLNKCGREIGLFPSQRISVISKPPKNKKWMKSQHRKYIASGTNVAIFHRPRSQRLRTRYLNVEEDAFQASSTKWSVFTIYLFDDERGIQEAGNSAVRDGFLKYGSVVILVDSVTGIALPRMRIRKVDKKQVILDATCSEEPVSQLHTCAFQMIGKEKAYLSLSDEKIIQHEAQIIGENRHEISDGAAWTIISAEKAEYRFFEATGQVDTPISPCPVVESLDVNGHGESTHVELHGRDFKPNLKIWFGSTPVETTFRSEENLSCKVPSVTKMKNEQTNWIFTNKTTGDIELPISLVRDDGVIYSSGLTYSYKSMERHGTV
ncbi:hypothetical protein CAEBREN_14524 [Caenorhabditis brenneri]|uniref:Uncharacterized protein n=1 Tax=Caenorhabditis brenneri TaxID=135651 RepID=G0NDT2_CAEBE|nr:hypothetical protein CAEBREN_14524 [Caenorhabditis brenneri]